MMFRDLKLIIYIVKFQFWNENNNNSVGFIMALSINNN